MTVDAEGIAAYARDRLDIEILPWQAQALDRVLNGNMRSTYISHPRRAGLRRGIEQMNAIMDELRDDALWASLDLAIVHQVAAKYIPTSNTKD